MEFLITGVSILSIDSILDVELYIYVNYSDANKGEI